MKLNNKGFGAIEIVLSIVIVGILGFVGWRAYTVYTDKPETGAEQSKYGFGEKEKKEEAKVTTNDELLISEWKVKLTGLNAKTYMNLGYIYSDKDDFVDLTYKDFKTGDDCGDTTLGIGISRSNKPLGEPGGSQWDIKKIGNYYFIGSGAPGHCEENLEKLKDGRQDLSELTDLFESLTAY